MLNLHSLLGQVQPAVDLKPHAPTPGVDSELRDILLIIGVALALSLGLFLYVYMTRRGRSSNSATGARALYRAEKKEPSAENHEGKHRKRRRRKEEFVQRNPTLGETGGLPPLRTEEPAEPVS